MKRQKSTKNKPKLSRSLRKARHANRIRLTEVRRIAQRSTIEKIAIATLNWIVDSGPRPEIL
jgi:hypothetical protein